MIREACQQDLNDINLIGLQIKDNFKDIYHMENVLKQDYAKVYVYEENNKILGFIHTEYHYEITDIINIAVKKEFHNKHIGSKLLQYLIDSTNSDKIMLEVRVSNINAINLYNKFGFKEINRRKKYYDNNEDAIIMERIIKDE